MNSEITTEKCPYCKYLITSDRISCSHCGTVSPELWKKRVTDDWEQCFNREFLPENIAGKILYHHGKNYRKYSLLHKLAEKPKKLFLSKIEIETQMDDIDQLFDRFVETKEDREPYYGFSQEYNPAKIKEGCKLFVIEIGGLYRFIGKDDDTIVLFEISISLHNKVGVVIDEEEAEHRREVREKNAKREAERQERIKDKLEKEREEYDLKLREYRRLPWWKKKLKSPPKKSEE